MTMRLIWSGVIVRNSEFRLMVKSAIFAAFLAATLSINPLFAQAPRIANLPKQNNVTNFPATAGQTAVANQPVDQFQELLDRAIEVTSKRYLTANSHSPWQIFHCILAMRQETLLRLGSEKVNAIQWLSTVEPKFDNEPWLLLTPHGAKFHPYNKKLYYFEGHPSQFLALLTHSDLPLDYPFHVQGKVVTLGDMVNNTMQEVNTNEEVTWVLWTLQHYLKSDATWLNQAKEPWSIEKLVQIESAAPVVGAPCGGNHRLFALTRTRDKYLKYGGQLRGVWLQADQKIKQHIEIARSLQNADGSFSAESYKGPMHTNDVNLRFNTTGHTMEFLSIALPDHRLNEPWVRNAVWMLSRELIIHRDTKIDCGPLFHTLDALILYRDRIRPKTAPVPTNEASPQIAAKPPELPTKSPQQTSPVPLPPQETPKVEAEPKLIEQDVVKQRMVKQPTVKQPIVEPPTVELKPKQPEPVATPEPLKTPMPTAEPVKIPEPIAPESEFVPPKIAEPQSRLPKANPGKSQKAKGGAPLPKIDPALLANVGQVAPEVARVSKIPEKLSQANRERPTNLAPALLPDSAAKPLSTSDLSTSAKDTLAKTAEPQEVIPLPPAIPTVDTVEENQTKATSAVENVSNKPDPIVNEPVSALAAENVQPKRENEDF